MPEITVAESSLGSWYPCEIFVSCYQTRKKTKGPKLCQIMSSRIPLKTLSTKIVSTTEMAANTAKAVSNQCSAKLIFDLHDFPIQHFKGALKCVTTRL